MGQAKLRLVPPEPELALEAEPDGPNWLLGVRVVAGPDLGATATFVDGVLRIGRNEDCHLRLTDPTVNERHAELSLAPEGLVLKDLRTRFGTWVGDQRIYKVFLGGIRLFRVGDTQIEIVQLPGPVDGG